jgi:hypothetical protein
MARRTRPLGLLALLALVAIALVVRRSYFYGKLLDTDDLSEEQHYRRCRRRLH